MKGFLERKVSIRSLVYGFGAVAILNMGLIAAVSQPDLENALASLRTARRSLIRADASKSSHRLNAIKLTDQAIVEVQAGIDAR